MLFKVAQTVVEISVKMIAEYDSGIVACLQRLTKLSAETLDTECVRAVISRQSGHQQKMPNDCVALIS